MKKRITNKFRKCEHCNKYYRKSCPYDGIYPEWWYRLKKCKKEEKRSNRDEKREKKDDNR